LGRTERFYILQELEKKLGSKLITLVTGDRIGVPISLALDILPIFHKFIFEDEKIHDNLTLFLYSRGGDAVTALSLVSLIREHYKKFNVLIPFRAHSAATLITLGANLIYMCKTGELSPIDVSLTTPYNPLVDIKKPKRPGNILPVSVEDLNGFIEFVKNILEIKEPSELIKSLEILCKKLNPLAIGALHRAREQNEQIAKTLMEYHIDDNNKIEEIAEILTRGLYTHSYLLSRNDTKKIGLPVVEIKPEIEKLIMGLHFEYFNLLELNIPYSPEMYLHDDNSEKGKDILLHRGIIETIISNELESYTYQTKKNLKWIETFDENIKTKIPKLFERNISHYWNINNEV